MTRMRLCTVAIALFLSSLPAFGQPDAAGAVRSFFQALAAGKYTTAWDLLSARSQKGIVDAVARESGLPERQVEHLFAEYPEQTKAFWESLRRSSRADILSKLQFRVVKKGKKEALVRYHPPGGEVVNVRCFLEGGQWKLGFLETFHPDGEIR